MTSVDVRPHNLEDASISAAAEEMQAGERRGADASALSPRVLKMSVVAVDVAALCFGVFVAFLVQRVVRPVPSDTVLVHAGLLVLSLPAFAIGAVWNRLYTARANARWAEEAGHLLRTVALGMGSLVALSVAIKYDELSRLWVLATAGSVTAALLVERYVVRRVFASLRRDRKLQRRILIVGTDEHAVALLKSCQHDPSLGYDVVGLVGDTEVGVHDGVSVVGPLSRVSELLVEYGATGVLVSIPAVGQDVNSITRRLTDQGYHVALSSSLRDIDLNRLSPQELDGQTLLYVERTMRGGWHSVAKRAFDIAVAVTVLVITLPVLLIAAIAVKLTSPGPVLFRQKRLGRDGKPFEIVKLRTMVVDAEEQLDDLRALNEADGPLFKMQRDPRATPVGRILRKLSIDELPQLWCVLRGTMSMVGPRPMLPSEAEDFHPDAVRQRLRVLPGLTGLWQVSGRSGASIENYCRFDQYYVDNWTLGHDLRICVRTVGVVLFGKGAM